MKLEIRKLPLNLKLSLATYSLLIFFAVNRPMTFLELRKSENWVSKDSTQVPFWQIVSIVARISSQVLKLCFFHWLVYQCSSENIPRSSHTVRSWCDFGCTSRKN